MLVCRHLLHLEPRHLQPAASAQLSTTAATEERDQTLAAAAVVVARAAHTAMARPVVHFLVHRLLVPAVVVRMAARLAQEQAQQRQGLVVRTEVRPEQARLRHRRPQPATVHLEAAAVVGSVRRDRSSPEAPGQPKLYGPQRLAGRQDRHLAVVVLVTLHQRLAVARLRSGMVVVPAVAVPQRHQRSASSS